jgi:hypothetical protein
MPSADQVPIKLAHLTMPRPKWVVLIAGSTGSALRGTNRMLALVTASQSYRRAWSIARRDAGEALTDIARSFGVSHTTIGRLTAAAPAI